MPWNLLHDKILECTCQQNDIENSVYAVLKAKTVVNFRFVDNYSQIFGGFFGFVFFKCSKP